MLNEIVLSVLLFIRLLAWIVSAIGLAAIVGFGAAICFNSDTAGVVAVSIMGVLSLLMLTKILLDFWRDLDLIGIEDGLKGEG